jgi:hypothetical protein
MERTMITPMPHTVMMSMTTTAMAATTKARCGPCI